MLSIIVITILTISFVLPFTSVMGALGTPTLSASTGTPGTKITVSGTAGNVTSGATVEIYWDTVIGSGAWLLNSTTGKSDGSYTVQITVPESAWANHYVWVKDTSTGLTARSAAFAVTNKISVAPTSGIVGDTITVTGKGFDDEVTVHLNFYNTTGTTIHNTNLTATSPPETNLYGSFTFTFTIPSVDYGSYTVNASDGTNPVVSTALKVGASISLSPDEGPEGTLITVTGRGFVKSIAINETDVTWDNWTKVQIIGNKITTTSTGTFSGQIVAPSWGIGTSTINVTDGTNWATETFDVDGAAKVTVSPTYGAPGATITVTGANYTQKADTTIDLYLNDTSVGTGKTLVDGTFTATFTVPALAFGQYTLLANSTNHVNDTVGFKIGIIAMLINPNSGPSGKSISLTGTGFAKSGTYNCSIGGVQVVQNGAISSTETFAKTIYVPTLSPGTYNVLVVDSAENELATTLTVTAITSLTPSISNAAVGYNVTFTGENFLFKNATALTWYVYNSTWESAPLAVNISDSLTATYVTGDGNFTGVWTVPADLLIGNTYTVNATASVTPVNKAIKTWAETSITIVEEEVEIRPNMASYSLGDTVTFRIRATFIKAGAVLQIEDPSGELYFESTFATGDWTEVDPWQVVQIRDQIDDNSMYPYIIPSDAATGTWTWTLLDADDDVIANGTIEVLPTTAAQVDARLSDVEGSIADLADDIASVTSDLEDDIDALSSEIGAVASDVDTLRDDIVSDLADDIAAATAAANAAGDAVDDLEGSLSDLEDSVGDIADTADDAKSAADAAAAAASNAATAAESASDAASGLTTLVYGAIGASLIAALAAIVSLMQISRRIAG